MKFTWVIEHPLPYRADWVFEHMDERLFQSLKPPAWMAEIQRNDGVQVGDEIWVRLKFPVLGLWKTKIIGRNEQSPFSFTDESKTQLPWGMKYWKHIHRVVPLDNQSCKIEEDVEWVANNALVGLFLNMGFKSMMILRRQIYEKYFEKVAIGVDTK